MSGARVLLVDDEPQMRLGMARVLKRAGYAVEEASDGSDALEKLRRGNHPVVVSDIRMPGLDGMTLLARAREVSPGSSFVMITAYGTVDRAVEAMRRGAVDYILKPFPPEVLERAVEEALRPAAGGAAAAADGRRIVTRDPGMLALLERAARAAASDATILIESESGAGKELFAHFIHEASPRSKGPFVALNCAAFPNELLESELFGHARGAFTGAVRERRGHFDAASGGTILLDEIGEMSPALQAKLLRVLQEHEFHRLGDEATHRTDVRVLAATNQDLRAAARAGRFREDLYFRLSVIPFRVPPLRERKGDIAPLVEHFCALHARGRNSVRVAPAALRWLEEHAWPGNVRELENMVLRAVVLAESEELGVRDFFPEQAAGAPPGGEAASWRGETIGEAERILIEEALRKTAGNRTRAAEIVGISVRTLRNKLREYREKDHGKNLPAGS